jgi:hypothetical protein
MNKYCRLVHWNFGFKFEFFRGSNSKVSVAGWSSLVARRAHNPKVVGSNPAPATILRGPTSKIVGLFFGTNLVLSYSVNTLVQ